MVKATLLLSCEARNTEFLVLQNYQQKLFFFNFLVLKFDGKTNRVRSGPGAKFVPIGNIFEQFLSFIKRILVPFFT